MNIPWDDALDPCRKIGEGEWYTPSSAQFRSILDKGDELWGTYKMSDGSTREGMYFGASRLPSEDDQNKYLFLPAAGNRSEAGMITNDGRYFGYYWSATKSSVSAENPFGLSFRKVNNGAHTGTGQKTNSDSGMTVRCVKDKPETKPEHAIDIGLDFYVAASNARAIKQADGTYMYTFAEEPGYYSGGINGSAYDPSGGDYFAWNTLDPTIEDVQQTSWEDARDVCRKIGDGQWFTPTQDQFTAIVDKGYCWSVYTMKDGTQVKGVYFGTTTAPTQADQNKYAFLPGAGERSSGEFWAQGYGYYWSTGSDGDGSTRGWPLQWAEGSHCSAIYDSINKEDGLTVRCIRNK